jgi:uncharacterized membrane protein
MIACIKLFIMKITLCVILLLAAARPLQACPLCNRKVYEGIFDNTFYPNLLVMLSAFIISGIIVFVLSAYSLKKYKRHPAKNSLSPVPLTNASIILGIGLGGFIDGILLHQILQLHEMFSAKIAATDYVGKSINMFWDGVFHFFCFVVVLTGIILLWKLSGRTDINRSGKLLAGGLLIGWSLFNIVEGILDHHLLKLHNVVEFSTNHTPGNLAFLVGSVIMLVIGYALKISATKPFFDKQSVL